MYEVLCVGLTSCDLIFAKLDKFPVLGKEVACQDFIIKAGGAANTPVALTKLGVKTVFCTAIGNDIPGKIANEYLEKMNLDISAVIRDDRYRTTVSGVLSFGEERGFVTYFAPDDRERMIKQIEKYAQCSSHIHAYIDDCLNMPIIDISRKYNRTLSVDTAWNEKIKLDDIKDIIKASNIFFTNEIESCSITGTDTAEEAIKLIGKYTDLVVVKLGKNGSLVKKGDELIRIPVVNGIKPVDTTGAGDLYGAGFIYGYIKGWDAEKCGCFATASANLAVTFYGGMDESYTLEQVNKYYERLCV